MKRVVDSSQASLFGVTFAEQQRKTELKAWIKNIHGCRAWIEAARSNKSMMFEIMLNIERYGGRHLPYFLARAFHDPNAPGPNPKDYDIGSYWTQSMTEGTRKFVVDIFTFVEVELAQELEQAQRELQVLAENRHFCMFDSGGQDVA